MTRLIVRSEQPFNAEPPLSRLRQAFITPEADFFVRSHGAVPVLNADEFRLPVDGLVAHPLCLSLAELQRRFSARTVVATLQCAGNRRGELHAVRPVSGDPWAAGAIGNAAWTGVALADVLEAASVPDDASLHVVFAAADGIAGRSDGAQYGASIPLPKARCPEVLLAYAMNGEALAAAHGFPLRAIVPGYAGVRSVKWLTGITVAAEPAPGPIQRHDYKLFPADVTAETADWEAGVTINELPLNAAICTPEGGADVAAGRCNVSGYAFASNREVTRVEVSADAGASWIRAVLSRPDDAPFGWTFWDATVTLQRGEAELVVRAWDSAGQTQPEWPAQVWNFKGYLCAAWHRVRVCAT